MESSKFRVISPPPPPRPESDALLFSNNSESQEAVGDYEESDGEASSTTSSESFNCWFFENLDILEMKESQKWTGWYYARGVFGKGGPYFLNKYGKSLVYLEAKKDLGEMEPAKKTKFQDHLSRQRKKLSQAAFSILKEHVSDAKLLYSTDNPYVIIGDKNYVDILSKVANDSPARYAIQKTLAYVDETEEEVQSIGKKQFFKAWYR